jgi:hypothetical protein
MLCVTAISGYKQSVAIVQQRLTIAAVSNQQEP